MNRCKSDRSCRCSRHFVYCPRWLRNDLAVQAGTPRSLDKVWGSSIDDLVQAYKMGGAKLVPKPPKLGTITKYQQYYDKQGNRLTYEAGQWKAWR